MIMGELQQKVIREVVLGIRLKHTNGESCNLLTDVFCSNKWGY